MENLIEELTAKNKEYIHSVTKQLILVGKSDEEVKEILNDILPQIIEGQNQELLLVSYWVHRLNLFLNINLKSLTDLSVKK